MTLKSDKHIRKNYEYTDETETREDILIKAHEYLNHPDKWTRILA